MVVKTVQERCSNGRERDPRKFRMYGSVADSGMKFVTDVEGVAEMLLLTIFSFFSKLDRSWLGSAHTDFAHLVASMSCVKLLLVMFQCLLLSPHWFGY